MPGRMEMLRRDYGNTFKTEYEGVKILIVDGRVYLDVTDLNLAEPVPELITWALAQERQYLEFFRQHPDEFRRLTRRKGRVYLVKSEAGPCKIGRTRQPIELRVFQLQQESTRGRLTLIHSFESDDAHTAEQKLHAIFLKKRIEGEWFDLDEADVQWIKSQSEIA